MTTTNRVRELLDPLDVCAVECDGFTRIAHHVLDREGITHEVLVGQVAFRGDSVAPHFWIVLPTGEVVDYRLRMWTNETAPHGVFTPGDDVKYKGTPTELHTAPFVVSILSGGMVA